ncbi:2-oxoisovalerate dehydrogenase subunit alpha mitochondrial [Ceratocystis platani]|uniref:2-oxoisovalerate dehydrogenase subunit alpha n=1 Tax=Ceratocystis fimbriata f. sp. platani TaxID=88771 RepID=A0A0F8DH68_CERFI|nr:2-oxoisovalerate dehydrogenase subunit alpha mitochondrial [Ceratocystis platani]
MKRSLLRHFAAHSSKHAALTTAIPRRLASSLSQRPNAQNVSFPGAVKSDFTNVMSFVQPAEIAALPTYRAIDAEGEPVDSSFVADLSDSEIVKLYRDMLFVAVMDLTMFDAQRQGRVSFYMVSMGEEAVCVGSASALEKDDVVFCQYREQGVFRQRGFTAIDFMNQLFSNSQDPGRGRNMPVHYGSSKLNIHTVSSPLATQLPQASGAAYALKIQHQQNPGSVPPRVVVAYFGEGAASEGDFHAALNIAATRGCPVIFLCRNNGYAISTPTLEQYRGDGIASRGIGYGIDTIRVDGNDFWAVRAATKRARQLALQDGGKPVLIEAMTYRVSHHSTSDDSFAYRAKVEVEEWKRRDNPIARLRKWMEHKGSWSEDLEQEARQEIKREVLEAFRKAEADKKPALRNMFTDVYEDMTPELEKQMHRLHDLLERYPDEYDVTGFDGGKKSLQKGLNDA